MDEDWADDLLALAEEPVKSKKKKSKKRKREETIDSASDMDVSAGSDAEVEHKRSTKGEDVYYEPENGAEPPNMYPLEGLYRDANDKASIMNMTEVERESILDERRTQMEQHRNRQLLKQMVAKGPEAGGESSEDDENQRSRRTGRTGKVKQLDELKKRRQAKSAREDKRTKGDGGADSDEDIAKPHGRSPSPVHFSSSDEDGEYGKSSKNRGKDKSKLKNGKGDTQAEPASLLELNKILLPRRKLAYLWPCEFFSEYVTGAYVRLGVGMHKGEKVYRLAQVAGIAEQSASRPYQLDKHVTDIKLQLSIAKTTKDFTMELISDTPATERELIRLIAELRQADMKVPTEKTVDAKYKVVRKYRDYSWNEADLNRVVAMKKRMSAASGVHRRQDLLASRDMALRNGDAEEVARLNARLGTGDDGRSSNVTETSPSKGQTALENGAAQNAFEDRRRTLLAASMTVSKSQAGQRPLNGSRPSSGASTPARQSASVVTPASPANDQAIALPAPATPPIAQAPTRFQSKLASKVDVDLGDF